MSRIIAPYRFAAAASNGLLTGLTSYWTFEESSGNAIDQHGSNDGTVTGATYGATGIQNDCYSYDGTADYVDFGNIATPSAYTWACWINISNVTDFRTVITKGDLSGSNEAYKMRIRSSTGYINSIVWYGTGSTFDSYNGNVDLADGSWHLVGQSFDGDEHQVWVDGSNVYTSSSLGGSTQSTSHNVLLGKSGHPSVHQYMNGSADEYGFWSRVLDSTDWSNLWNGGSGITYSDFTT